jgi:hypothetical protein
MNEYHNLNACFQLQETKYEEMTARMKMRIMTAMATIPKLQLIKLHRWMLPGISQVQRSKNKVKPVPRHCWLPLFANLSFLQPGPQHIYLPAFAVIAFQFQRKKSYI